MPLTTREREDLIARYEAGPATLKAAFDRVPEEARKWRPGPDKWSAHEVIVHAADSETNAAMRIRYVLAENDPVIQGYDQARWAKHFDYHRMPLAPAFAAIEAVRANTVPLLRSMSDSDWQKKARHSESGSYGAESWLKIYAEHLEKHSGQIERNLAAWKASK
jgi:hypothetical protein